MGVIYLSLGKSYFFPSFYGLCQFGSYLQSQIRMVCVNKSPVASLQNERPAINAGSEHRVHILAVMEPPLMA